MCNENEPSQKKLNILYNTIFGRILLKLIFSTRWFSYLAGVYYKSRFSLSKLKKFIRTNNLQSYEKNIDKYNSFNDFFIRKEQRNFTYEHGALISPCDSLVSVYNITDTLILNIKSSSYSLQTLLQNNKLAEKYIGGTCIIYRLTLLNYHRFMFAQSGLITNFKTIKGCLHTVRPLSNAKNNYFENTRAVTQMATHNFGNVVQVEIGAMLVGKIVNHNTSNKFKVFDEKGYFEFGGSTIVQLFEANSVKICEDILKMSNKNIECEIVMGEKIGNV